MNSKSVAKLAACASATLLLWVSLTSFSPAVTKNAEGFTEGNAESFTEGNTERNIIGTLSELNQIEYEKHLLPSNSISAGCGYSWLSNEILTANGESLNRTPTAVLFIWASPSMLWAAEPRWESLLASATTPTM